MGDVEFTTPRGLTLSGSFVNPVDSGDAAVLFSHSFLADRYSGQHFDRLARAYRGAGYATLSFDYSGHGRSDDDVIVTSHQVEDLQAASGWLADQGFPRQVIHGHSFGAVAALAAHLPAARTLIVSGAILSQVTFAWEEIFSAEQLDELDATGQMSIPDDSDGPRQSFTISKQTLADLSLVDGEALVRHQQHPILFIHDADDERMGLVDITQQMLPRFPAGSRVEVVHDGSFGAGENLDFLSSTALEWARLHVPIVR